MKLAAFLAGWLLLSCLLGLLIGPCIYSSGETPSERRLP